MSSRRNHHSWLPHIYVILIGVSLGGALLFSLIFIGAYYYVSLKNTFPSHRSDSPFQDASNVKSPPYPPQAHSSPKGGDKLEKRQSNLKDTRSLRSIDLKTDSSADSMNICDSNFDKGRHYKKQTYLRAKSFPEHDRKFEKHDKLDRKRWRNKSTTPPSRRTEDDGSEIEININDLIR